MHAELPDIWDFAHGTWEACSGTSRFKEEAAQETLVKGIREMTSFMFNEYVLGQLKYSPDKQIYRLLGRIDRVRFPSKVFYIADGEPKSDRWITVWDFVEVRGDNLYNYNDAYDKSGLMQQFDPKRHNKVMNTAYADGHVQGHVLSREALKDILINDF